jgi:uncharacterized protein YdeI (YjbR/CyaY-like superfamily)
MKAVPASTDYPILAFAKPKEWEKWLRANYAKSQGVWMKYYKKGSGKPTISYAEALDVALCYGWIDSQAKGLNAEAYLQKWTPRRVKSVWSKINREHVARLIKEKRMRAPGLAAIEAAKKDGRWDAAYAGQKTMTVPAAFLKALKANKKAQAFYATLNKANTYAIAWRLHHAKKEETRAKLTAKFIAMLARGEKLH